MAKAEPAKEEVDVRWYFLDPDYRREPPEHNSYCVRCQKPLKRGARIVHVTVDWKMIRVREGGKDLMGERCWKDLLRDENLP